MDVLSDVLDTIELRGTLSYAIATEGDEIDIGRFIIGMRTAKQIARAAIEAGIDLGQRTTLVLAVSAEREMPQPTQFEAGILDPTLLNPASDRFGATARLSRQWKDWNTAASFKAEWISAGSPGEPPYDFRLARQTGLLEAAWTSPGGAKLRAAAGADRLTALDGAIAELRPVYAASIDWPFRGGLEVRAAINAGFDTVDGDDPVASWLQRVELEASKAIGDKLVVAGGVFSARRENLSLLTVEHAQGFYVEASRPFGRHVTGVVRLDASRRHETVTEVQIHGIDMFVGLTGSL